MDLKTGLLRPARRLQKNATERFLPHTHKDTWYTLGRRQPSMAAA
jgi:hypothetical protein